MATVDLGSSVQASTVTGPSTTWATNHAPSAGSLAVAQKAAAASGIKHVCTSVSGSWSSDGTNNGAAQNVVLVVRDGATTAGTILGQWTLARTTTTAADGVNQGSFALSGLNLPGTSATAMTLEFTGTASNHTIYSAVITGYDITA